MQNRTDNGLDGAKRRWLADPCSFITEVLREPRTRKPYVLFPEQEKFIRESFTLTPTGRLPYATAVYSTPKKQGKSSTAAMLAIFTAVVIGGVFASIYILANDFDQSVGVVFELAKRIIEASPALRGSAKITATRIEFPSSHAFIQAVPHDFAGLAGIEPTLVILDELWAFTGERSQRLYDEAVPVPTIKVSGRLVVTYAGFSNESTLLEGLYKRGLQGNEIAPALYAQPGLLMYWTHEFINRTPDALQWAEEMKRDARPSAYVRQVRNEWTSSESKFIDAEMYDRCVDSEARPCLIDQSLTVFCGLDASLRHDSTALVAVTYDWRDQRVRLVAHKLFRPQGEDIDFSEVEAAVVDFRQRFAVKSVSYDPYQLEVLGQRLRTKGVEMVAFDQTSGNLTAAADGLFELFQGRNIALYPDPDVREAVLNASVKESTRGYRLAKEKPSKKIDLCVALSFACLAAIREGAGQIEEYAYRPVVPKPSYRDLDSSSSWATDRANPNCNFAAIAEMEDAHSAVLGRCSRRFRWLGTW